MKHKVTVNKISKWDGSFPVLMKDSIGNVKLFTNQEDGILFFAAGGVRLDHSGILDYTEASNKYWTYDPDLQLQLTNQ